MSKYFSNSLLGCVKQAKAWRDLCGHNLTCGDVGEVQGGQYVDFELPLLCSFTVAVSLMPSITERDCPQRSQLMNVF